MLLREDLKGDNKVDSLSQIEASPVGGSGGSEGGSSLRDALFPVVRSEGALPQMSGMKKKKEGGKDLTEIEDGNVIFADGKDEAFFQVPNLTTWKVGQRRRQKKREKKRTGKAYQPQCCQHYGRSWTRQGGKKEGRSRRREQRGRRREGRHA